MISPAFEMQNAREPLILNTLYFLRELDAHLQEIMISIKEVKQVLTPLESGAFGCQKFTHSYEYRRDLQILTYGNICNKKLASADAHSWMVKKNVESRVVSSQSFFTYRLSRIRRRDREHGIAMDRRY